jgi:hypothetical protein
LHVTGHAIDGFARIDGFSRVSRHVNWVVRRQRRYEGVAPDFVRRWYPYCRPRRTGRFRLPHRKREVDMNRRQAIAGISAMTASFALDPSRSVALDSITPINANDAKELGLKFRARAAGGPNAVWVELTFEAAGKLAGFTHVDLHMYDGEKLLLTTILSNRRAGSGHFEVSFFADRGNVDKITLSVMKEVGEGSEGYVLRVKDVIDLKRLG